MKERTVLQRRGRDRLDIMYLILEEVLKGALKTHIMYRVGLTYANLHSYLLMLKDLRLIEETEENGNQIFKITEKGVQYIESYRSIRHLLIMTKAIEDIEKKSKRVTKNRRTPSTTEKALSTREELLLVVSSHERLFKIINSRLSSLEKKLDTIHTELKENKKKHKEA